MSPSSPRPWSTMNDEGEEKQERIETGIERDSICLEEREK